MFITARARKLTLAALTTLSLLAGAITYTPAAQRVSNPVQALEQIARKGSFDITERTDMAKVNEYEGQHRIAKKGSFDITEVARKVNEYEGQHRIG
jgi:hypothetical protein